MHPLGDVASIGTGRLGVVMCASVGWSGTMVGGDGALGDSGCVEFRRWCVEHGLAGLG